jgi:2-succinyl-6-hydroxy-2,4-cyclohexadiene-1-carboxylate synthase
MTLDLHVRVAGSGPPLVLLHGFTGSADAWGLLADRLAERFRVLAFDLPGHGASPAPEDPSRARLPQVADALIATLDRQDVGAACWLGYSLGGRLALQAALDHPARVRALVLEGASPGIADSEERRARAAADAALADSIERDGLAAFVERWLAQPLFATQASLPAAVQKRERARRLAGSAAGYAAALRAMGTGEQEPLWTRLHELRVPVLLVAGASDVKYAALAQAMASALPDARVALISGAGHTVHLEQPHAWLDAVEPFLCDAAGLRTAGAA